MNRHAGLPLKAPRLRGRSGGADRMRRRRARPQKEATTCWWRPRTPCDAEVAPKLETGIRMLSETVRADAREGDISMQLGEIAKANPGVAIGSYPFFEPQHGPNTNVVLRAPDPQRLALAKRAVEDMLERVRRAQSNNA